MWHLQKAEAVYESVARLGAAEKESEVKQW
jgi:hypothetical protein